MENRTQGRAGPSPDAAETARHRLLAGDAAGALRRLEPELWSERTPDAVRTLGARAYRALGRPAEAARLLNQVFANAPDNGVVAHNLAAAMGDAGDHERSIPIARRAITLKDAPESWLVLGKALQAVGDLAGTRHALEQAVRRRPGYVEPLQLLAQLIWMTTGDAEAAVTPVRRALRAAPSPELAAIACGMMKDMGEPRMALTFIDDWTGRGAVDVELAAAAAAAQFDAGLQAAHAAAALALAPDLPRARHADWTARLGLGEPETLLDAIAAWLLIHPHDQIALGLQSAARRLAGHPLAFQEADYGRLVRTWDLEPPAGRADRAAWLGALSEALHRLHSFRAEPFGQSVRAGAQSRVDPRHVGDPVIDATFDRIHEAITDYVAWIDPAGPMGRRNTGAATISGAWSVLLNAGGRHSDHVHPQGWISSAFYVAVPEPTPAEPVGGWLRFGAMTPGPDLALPAEYRIEPKPGRLALFPSFLWHGTEPFSGGGERLTLAFDAVPA